MNYELSFDVLMEYNKYYPGDDCGKEPVGGIVIICRENDEQMFIQPKFETNETFLDRLKRSKAAGRNLFYEEWEPFEYTAGADY